MKKTLLLTCLMATLFSYEDLGTFGPVYDVKERNMKTAIKEALVEKHDKIKEMARTAFENGLTYKKELPFSSKDSLIENDFSLTVPGGENKGLRIGSVDIPYVVKDSICVVSFDGYNILDELIMEFGSDCRYVFLNVNIQKISGNEKYKNIQKFIGNDIFFNIFDVNATPVKVSIDGANMTTQYLDYKRIEAQAKKRLLSGDLQVKED